MEMQYLGWTVSEGRYTGIGWQFEYILRDPDGLLWGDVLSFSKYSYVNARPWRLRRVLESHIRRLNKKYERQQLNVNLDG